jgi:DUF1365 family protein
VNSALYTGRVEHRRLGDRPHAFAYRLFMLYLDLDELPQAFDPFWLWSARRAAPAWFRRADYHGAPDTPLDEAVRDTVHARTGERPNGPVRLLTHLRYLGIGFNPVSFYYCFENDGETLHSILAEITNTPWNERHAYALRCATSAAHQATFDKALHVSPFLPMDHRYEWRFSTPGERIRVAMRNRDGHATAFTAGLHLERRPLDSRNLARALATQPCMSAVVLAGIYWQALRLWAKRAPFHPHPKHGLDEKRALTEEKHP